MDVHNTDVYSGYPRAQLATTPFMTDGDALFCGWGLYLPSDFPVIPETSWMVHHEVYGAPFAGSGPNVMWLINDEYRFYMTDPAVPGPGTDIRWSLPIVRGQWVDFIQQVKLSSDPAVGYVSIAVNTGSGWVQQTFTGGGTKLYRATRNAANDGSSGGTGNFSSLKQARRIDTIDRLVTYTTGQRVGLTAADVDPHSFA